MTLLFPLFAFALLTVARATVVFEGRVPLTLNSSVLDTSASPFTTGVRGLEAASHYTSFLGTAIPPTALEFESDDDEEQAILITIDATSIFVPGGSNPQYGFRRTELIAPSALNVELNSGKTEFHFSLQVDEELPLDYRHEYQIVFIEPSDGSHVFGVQLGTPFTIPAASDPAPDATSLKVLDHANNILFATEFTEESWHNFAVTVDWDALTLQVSYSQDGDALQTVTDVVPNPTVAAGTKGDFHFGVLKLPLANPDDTPEEQGDVVNHGIQEDTLEGLRYSGVFVTK